MLLTIFIYFIVLFLYLSFRFNLSTKITRFYYNTGDVINHLILIYLIKQNNNRIIKETPQFLLSDVNDYPSFYHKLMSYFPTDMVEKFGWFSGILFDSLYLSMVYWVSWWFANIEGVSNAIETAVIASIIFAFTPLLYDHEGRTFRVSERPMGDFLGAFALLSTIFFIKYKLVIWLILALASIIIVVISSKFALQAVVFISIILSLIDKNIWYILIPLFGILLSFILTKGYALTVLKGSIRHSYYYATRFLKIMPFYYSSYLLPLSLIKLFFSKSSNSSNIISKIITKISKIKYLLMQDSLFKTFFLAPLIIYLIYLVVISYYPITHSSYIETTFLNFVLASFLVAFIIAIKPLKFLGEPERYIIFSLTPLTSLIAFKIASSNYFSKSELFILLSLFLITNNFIFKVSKAIDNKEKYYELEKIKKLLLSQGD
ncbi:MAG: hypothetical protein JRI44_13190, partial [Deltaproteobacteria bacterium]|nr:hypothetical protein [Deltaproteobacteria bacterium]